jgi:hypothetical protein
VTDLPVPAPPFDVTVRGNADDEEVAAILAALTALWPRPGMAAAAASAEPERWRFSGRWWAKPVPMRRDRPGGAF